MNIDATGEPQHVELWQAQEEDYGRLRKLEVASPELIYGPDWTQEVLKKDPDFIGCVDERVKPGDHSNPKIGLAGCGVLWNPEKRRAAAEKIKAAGLSPSEVNWHKHCGACGEYCKGQAGELPEAVGKKTAEDLAQQLGAQVTSSGYAAGDVPMTGPADFHPARAVVVDGTGRFNISLLGKLEAFTLSAAYYPDTATLAGELAFIQNIAMGDHGFGQQFTAENPLIILLAGRANDPTWNADTMQKTLQETLTRYGDRAQMIKLDF